MLCELAEKLMRSGHEPQARSLWQQARAGYPDDVWIYVQAGIEYSDMGDHAEALDWLTAGLELALRTGDPELLFSSFVCSTRPAAAFGAQPDDIQEPGGPEGAQASDKRPGERQEASAGRPVRGRESHRARRAARCPGLTCVNRPTPTPSSS